MHGDAPHPEAPHSEAPHFEAPHFEAIITPHRSLGPLGLKRLVAFILILSSGVSTGLWIIGAWPAIAFNAIEIGLALTLLYRHNRDRRTTERLVLDDRGLTIHRDKQPPRRLNAAWLQAVLDERPGRTPALLLIHRGHRMEVAADLGEAEKRDLALHLRAALHRQRHPTFQNPQLT